MSATAPLADEAARTRIGGDLDATLIVEAAAGTGKTTQLVRRMVSVIDGGRATLDRMVAVTFTEKAAGEMKLRLRGELERARLCAGDETARLRHEHALESLELAHINTIHGFCADLLRERPLEAGVDPAFEVLDDGARERLLEQAFDDWFEAVLADPPEGVRRVLQRAGARSPRSQLLDACRGLIEQRDLCAPFSAPSYAREAEIDALVAHVHAIAALAAALPNRSDRLVQSLRTIRDHAVAIAELEARALPHGRDYDRLEARLAELLRAYVWKGSGSGRMLGEGIERARVLEQRDHLHAALRVFIERADADIAAKLQRELELVVRGYEQRKQKAGMLDFVDLLLCVRDLLRDDLQVRAALQQRFTHLFVDEFQDTDPLQAEILLLLAADPTGTAGDDTGALVPVRGKLFLVGDPKQSIYRFRRADVALYEQVKRRLLQSGAELLHLNTSFRARPEIQATVNAAFEQSMSAGEDGSQAAYVPLAPFRPANPEQPAVIALPVPQPYGARGLTKAAVEASYPDAVAALIAWLIGSSGFTIDEDGARVPIEARHVCLLFRRFRSAFGDDLTRGYVRGLEARRIPHVLVGGRSLHGREEVIALRAALAAIEWPDDELHVYATLRGPFFAISDEELLRYRSALGGRIAPLRKHDDPELREHPAVCAALAVLARLHRRRNLRPIGDTIARLLEETRAHAGVAIWPTGEQALANLASLIDTARAFESRSAFSFRGFVEWLDDQAERNQGSEAMIVEEGAEGVRLMTVHKAKGLEFPVVVLCDPTAPREATYAVRFTDPARGMCAQRLCGCRPQELIDNEEAVLQKDEAELVRLAYVAATRARDLLIVPVFGDARGGNPGMGWADALAPAVYPADGARRSPAPAPGCPPFGDDSVLRTNQAAGAALGSGVRPGLHRGMTGASTAVWWDPHVLTLDAQPLGGVRQQHLLTATERSSTWLTAYAEWTDARTRTLDASSQPSAVLHTVTALAARRAEERAESPLPAVAIEHTDAVRADRPRGARFGILVHAILAQIPLDADANAIAALAVLQQRILGAPDTERSAAIAAVAAALRHPLMLRAARALECHREAPMFQRLPDGTLVHGVADLAFRESQGFTVVDFKTDADLQAAGKYTEQLALYMNAIAAATGEPVTGVLLAV